MRKAWLLLMPMCCAALVVSFDLGPIIRIGQCRSECLRKYDTDGDCKRFSNCSDVTLNECWKYCEMLENTEKGTMTICTSDQYLYCPACQTACAFHNTRVVEKYEPSMLPAPNKGPVSLSRYDVAIAMRRDHQEWKESGYYPGNEAPDLRPDTWIIVVTEDGLRHYSWQEWVPTLDSLKEGPLFEATISWRDMRQQLRRQQKRRQKSSFNNRKRQLFLEKYGEKVLNEWRSPNGDSLTISRDLLQRFFFKKQNDDESDKKSLETFASFSADNDGTDENENNVQSAEKQSFVVTWGPETGGLTGNQVTDCDSAQISLLPGTKYLVRVASNDGPGSFPILVDTRPAIDYSSALSFSSSPSSSSSSSSSSSAFSSSSSSPSFKCGCEADIYRSFVLTMTMIMLLVMLSCLCLLPAYYTFYKKVRLLTQMLQQIKV